MDITSWIEAFSIFLSHCLYLFPTSMERSDKLQAFNSADISLIWRFLLAGLRLGLQGAHCCRKKSMTGPRCMFSSSTTIQLALKFALTQPHPMLSHPRQRPLVMLLVKSFAILGMLVIALQSIHSVGFATHVAGAGALIMLLLVLFRSLVLAHRILRSQSIATAINCLALVVTPLSTELN